MLSKFILSSVILVILLIGIKATAHPQDEIVQIGSGYHVVQPYQTIIFEVNRTATGRNVECMLTAVSSERQQIDVNSTNLVLNSKDSPDGIYSVLGTYFFDKYSLQLINPIYLANLHFYNADSNFDMIITCSYQ